MSSAGKSECLLPFLHRVFLINLLSLLRVWTVFQHPFGLLCWILNLSMAIILFSMAYLCAFLSLASALSTRTKHFDFSLQPAHHRPRLRIQPYHHSAPNCPTIRRCVRHYTRPRSSLRQEAGPWSSRILLWCSRHHRMCHAAHTQERQCPICRYLPTDLRWLRYISCYFMLDG